MKDNKGGIKVSIVIPTKNGENDIKECLSGIFKQKTDYNFEVIVIDSGSTDNTLDIVDNFPAKLVKIKPSEFNHGDTRNLGAKLAVGEYIVFMVQDAVPANELWLQNLIRNFDDEKVAGVYSRQKPKPGASPIVVKHLNSWVTAGTEKIVTRIEDKDKYNSLSPFDKRIFVNFDDISSCMRKSIWKEEPYSRILYGEDIEWSKRVLEKGYTIIYEPESIIYHSHEPRLKYEFKRRYIDHKINRRLFNLVLFPSLYWVIRGIFADIKNNYRTIRESDLNFKDKIKWGIYNPFLVLVQISGTYLGAKSEDITKKYPMFKIIENSILKGV